MKNYWLNRFRIGKRVKYKGFDAKLKDKQGYVVRILDETWIDVRFEFVDKGITQLLTVEKDNLEIV